MGMVYRFSGRDRRRKEITMIRISQLKISVDKIDTTDAVKEQEAVRKAVIKAVKIAPEELKSVQIIRRSLDARKKEDIHYSYIVEASLEKEDKVLKNKRLRGVEKAMKKKQPPFTFGTEVLTNRPVVAGFGPAGMFCALELSRAGYCPLVIERGAAIEQRVEAVETFWNTGVLNPSANVQFGEGGAGTFSDGKLNTMVKDKFGRGQKVLEDMVRFGAPEEIAYMNKPHIGTDRLRQVVKGIRQEILRLGGEIRFNTQLTDFKTENGALTGIELNHQEWLDCQALILAVGHSARDTFAMLKDKALSMEAKAFAIGVRIEHPQELINSSQYGEAAKLLPAADYKLTHQAENGRGVYSFCMCPGGFVVNASSEQEHLVVNGMSNHDRGERNANSAMIVTVTPEDYGADGPLSGVEFQRKWEKKAFEAGKGKIPVQTFRDFEKNMPTGELGRVKPNVKGAYTLSNVRECLPDYVSETIIEGVHAFDSKINGFGDGDAVISGVETRTSSPLRILRNEGLESSVRGIYPCGEGAGYAGGIMSAAMDGLKVFEAVAGKYKPEKEEKDRR